MNIQYYPLKFEIVREGIVQNPWEDSDKLFLYNDNTVVCVISRPSHWNNKLNTDGKNYSTTVSKVTVEGATPKALSHWNNQWNTYHSEIYHIWEGNWLCKLAVLQASKEANLMQPQGTSWQISGKELWM